MATTTSKRFDRRFLGHSLVALIVLSFICSSAMSEGFGSIRAANRNDDSSNNRQSRELGVVDGTFAGHRVTQEKYDAHIKRDSHDEAEAEFKAVEEAHEAPRRANGKKEMEAATGRFPALSQQTSESGESSGVNSGHAPAWRPRTRETAENAPANRPESAGEKSHDIMVRTSGGTYHGVRSLPGNAESIENGKLKFKYDPMSGHFYYPYFYQNQVVYLSVVPPAGTVVHEISDKYTEKDLDGKTVYFLDGVYLTKIKIDGEIVYQVLAPDSKSR